MDRSLFGVQSNLDLSSGTEHKVAQVGNPDFLTLRAVGKEQKFLTVVFETLLAICSKKMSSANVFILALALQSGVDQSNRAASDWVKQHPAALAEGLPEIIAGMVKNYKAK